MLLIEIIFHLEHGDDNFMRNACELVTYCPAPHRSKAILIVAIVKPSNWSGSYIFGSSAIDPVIYVPVKKPSFRNDLLAP
jgi:hypothetical protein